MRRVSGCGFSHIFDFGSCRSNILAVSSNRGGMKKCLCNMGGMRSSKMSKGRNAWKKVGNHWYRPFWHTTKLGYWFGLFSNSLQCICFGKGYLSLARTTLTSMLRYFQVNASKPTVDSPLSWILLKKKASYTWSSLCWVNKRKLHIALTNTSICV